MGKYINYEIGKVYDIKCAVIRKSYFIKGTKTEYVCDLHGNEEVQLKLVIVPLLDHLHHDNENGQKYKHYHMDERFNCEISSFICIQSKGGVRISESDILEYLILPLTCVDDKIIGSTDKIATRNSTFKSHKCLMKGKCLHRNYDLSDIKPINGIIKCPLHGLEYNAETKKLIN
jgi:hypothetical protein